MTVPDQLQTQAPRGASTADQHGEPDALAELTAAAETLAKLDVARDDRP